MLCSHTQPWFTSFISDFSKNFLANSLRKTINMLPLHCQKETTTVLLEKENEASQCWQQAVENRRQVVETKRQQKKEKR